jgi:cell division protein FtsZ
MHEFEEVASIIHKEMDEEANIILGMSIDQSIVDEVRVTVIATGIGRIEQVAKVESSPARPRRLKPEGIIPELNYDYLQIPTVVRHRTLREQAVQEPAPVKKRTFLQKLTGAPAGASIEDEDLNIPTFIRRQAD